MLNIAFVNMPKIKPETKVLIIKTLKSKSPAEVADIFNVSKRQVERICKHYQETGDVHDRPRSGRPSKTAARDDSSLVRLSKARPMSTTSQLQEEWSLFRQVTSCSWDGACVSNADWLAPPVPPLSRLPVNILTPGNKTDHTDASHIIITAAQGK